MAPQQLVLTPIGVIRTGMHTKFEAPRQPDPSDPGRHIIELFPGHNFERALQDLNGFGRIWLLWWFHKNTSWRPLVLPPRGPAQRRGVFATRSPHRPNPLGISAVPLHEIRGRELIIGSTDLVDGTPILDIKPYVSTVDAFPDAALGWLADLQERSAAEPRFDVTRTALVGEQAEWLRSEWKIDFMNRAMEILAHDPSPHRTRRISRLGDQSYRMGCGGWKVVFSVNNATVMLERIIPGYPLRLLRAPGYDEIPDREAQVAFGERWPDTSY